MSKVLFVVPVGQDMGGIITSTEQYVAGLAEAGHDVTFICAVFTKQDQRVGPQPRGKFAGDYQRGPGTGCLYHPTQGWRGEPRVSIACKEGVDRFVRLANEHDIVIWASMYGFRNEATEGNTTWLPAITRHRAANVFMIHDDHIQARYPWALALAKYAAAYVGVQPCSYDSLEGVASSRAMVYTPLPAPPKRVRSVDDRSGFLSCQIWKTWKRADALVAAAPYMPKKSVTFAGDGIQLRYMKSQDKCPPRYAGLWDAAMKKQIYAGILSEAERDDELHRAKFLVDLSTRSNSGQLNRIVQEAMAAGCVVIANPAFISGTRKDPLFKPGVHYWPVDSALYDKPEDLAAYLKHVDKNMLPDQYAKMQKTARKELDRFDRQFLADALVDIGNSAPAGWDFEDANEDKELMMRARAEFINVFGAKP